MLCLDLDRLKAVNDTAWVTKSATAFCASWRSTDMALLGAERSGRNTVRYYKAGLRFGTLAHRPER